jgi:tRNA G18 (ribose-2'-O)-methylase SpoU
MSYDNYPNDNRHPQGEHRANAENEHDDDDRDLWSIQEVSALSRKKVREETGCMLVEGRHPIEEAIRAGLEMELAFVQKEAAEQSLPTTEWPFEPNEVDDKMMSRLADTKSAPPCLAIFRQPQSPPASDLQNVKGLVLVLYEVQDPGNLGALMRSAVAFGASAVVLLGGAVDAYSPKVIRASAGIQFALPVYNIGRGEFLDQCRALKPRIYITSSHESSAGSSQSAREADYSGNCFLVLGNEGHGVDAGFAMSMPNAKSLMIPMDVRVESLNVAICGSILLAEAAAQRDSQRRVEQATA